MTSEYPKPLDAAELAKCVCELVESDLDVLEARPILADLPTDIRVTLANGEVLYIVIGKPDL